MVTIDQAPVWEKGEQNATPPYLLLNSVLALFVSNSNQPVLSYPSYPIMFLDYGQLVPGLKSGNARGRSGSGRSERKEKRKLERSMKMLHSRRR